MPNVVGFFEQAGSDSRLRNATRDEMASALKNAGIEPVLRKAILERNPARMHGLLDADNKIHCSVFPVKVPVKTPARKPAKAPPKKPGKKPVKPGKK